MRLPHQRRLAIYELFFTRAGLCKQTWEENIHTDSVHDTEQPLLSGRSVKSRQHVQRHITRRTQAKIVFRSRYFYSLSFHLSGILADSRQPGMMLFFLLFKSLQLSQWQESEASVGPSRDTHAEWGKEKDLWLKCVCVVSYIID